MSKVSEKKSVEQQEHIFREHADRLALSEASRLPDGWRGYTIEETLNALKEAINKAKPDNENKLKYFISDKKRQ